VLETKCDLIECTKIRSEDIYEVDDDNEVRNPESRTTAQRRGKDNKGTTRKLDAIQIIVIGEGCCWDVKHGGAQARRGTVGRWMGFGVAGRFLVWEETQAYDCVPSAYDETKIPKVRHG